MPDSPRKLFFRSALSRTRFSTRPLGKSPGFRMSDCPRGVLEPGPRFTVNKLRELLADARVIGVQPVAFVLREQLWLHEIDVDGRQRDRLETHHRAFAAGHALGLRHDNEILDADAVFAGFVIAGLVRADHAGLERL